MGVALGSGRGPGAQYSHKFSSLVTAKDLPTQRPLHMRSGALQGLTHKDTLSPAPEGPAYLTAVLDGPLVAG